MSEKLGILIRSFKGKKTPEPIAHDDKPSDTSRDFPCTLNDMTLKIYNVFGIPLEEAAKINELFENSNNFTPIQNSWESKFCTLEYQKYVPKMVLKCVRFVNDYGIKEEGIYRVSGSGQEVKELKDAFIQHGPSYDIPPTTDVHAITSLIKSFVRDLPEELLPVNCHKFLAYSKTPIPLTLSTEKDISNFSIFTEEEENLNPVVIPTQIIQEILQDLSPHQFALVQTLTRHFAAVAQHSQHNRMTLNSLSLILCPTLKIHKSVFNALIIKTPHVWSNLHPKQSDMSARSVKYDTRRITTYSQNNADSSVTLSKFVGDAPSSPSVASVSVGESRRIQENSLSHVDKGPSSKLNEKGDHQVLFHSDEQVDEYYDNGVISFSNPLDLSKLQLDSIIPSTSSSLSSFSDSSSHNSRSSDTIEYSEVLKYPPPQFSTKHEYRYKQSDDISSTSKPKSCVRNSPTTTSSTRTLFLQRSSLGT